MNSESRSEHCRNHPLKKVDMFCRQFGTETRSSDSVSHGLSAHKTERSHIATVANEETKKLEEFIDNMVGLLGEVKQAMSVVRQHVRIRKEHNIGRTKMVFNALCKAIHGT